MATLPRNTFKARLNEPGIQYGLWVSLADPIAAEISAGAGLDWLLIDGEHSPNDLRTVLGQLHAIQNHTPSAIVRPLKGDVALIKQYLDIGVQTILVPMVESADQAAEMVRAVRYPPVGLRGVATARAAQWGRIEGYANRADSEMCVIVQIESAEGLRHLDAIAAVEGVDALFVGPSDLGAALGHLGDPNHPEVRAAVSSALGAIRSAGKAAGVLGATPELAREYATAGATFVGVGVDTILLAKATRALADSFKQGGHHDR